ncbi:NADPH-dependent methylglyoxal reductase GRE2 [Leucoagaricus sp. SymC.cos]|nr:NADPH-dependent methylglyoxal reductase GRE2 [Leucoagaricus sp. SymC.cos]
MGVAIVPSKILVTGANGFIAMWVVDTLLKGGYSVRGTVRSRARAEDLEKRFANFIDNGQLEFVVVADIGEDGAFDAAVDGVDGIIHMASPVLLDADDPQELIAPAIAGTLGILKSALANQGTLKRIVFTSSTAAIMIPVTEPTTFSESDWNSVSVREVEELGKEAHPMHKYRASKTLAERAIWDFFKEHKHSVNWDVTTINPPFVFGPILNYFDHPSEQNATTKMWWDFVIANPPTPQSVVVYNSWVDVRDVALGHVLALQKPEAGGERLIVSAGAFVWQDWLDVASTHRSPLKSHTFAHHQEFNGFLPRGFPDIERNRLTRMDSSKAARVLGPELKYRSMEETTKDILLDYAERGW